MKYLRITNCVLLPIVIILTFIFLPNACKQEKYGTYDKQIKIQAVSKDRYQPVIYFDVENEGDLSVSKIVLDVTIENKNSTYKKATFEVTWSFGYDYLVPKYTKSMKTTLYTSYASDWIADVFLTELKFTYKIKNISFEGGTIYEYSE